MSEERQPEMQPSKMDVGDYIESCKGMSAEQHSLEMGANSLLSALGIINEKDFSTLMGFHAAAGLIDLAHRVKALEDRMDSDPRGE